MDTIDAILKDKGTTVHGAAPGDSVFAAVEKMCQHRVGAVLVLEHGEPVGIFTERDLMTRVILARRDPATTKVSEVMSTDIAIVEPHTKTKEAMAVMTERRCRHLPVVKDGQLVGMVSIGDLVRKVSWHQEFEIQMLTDYIVGKYPG